MAAGRRAKSLTTAVLFALSIGVLGTSNVVVLKILGIGTALAVLGDSILVRCLLLPAVLTLLGGRAWSLPPSLARLHRRIDLHKGGASAAEPCPPRAQALTHDGRDELPA
jgi:uncharacterized membrane protein YdfJ with MMPL/SSD domain